MGVSLQDINRTVGGEVHLTDINLELESGSRNVILGHTLAGKTSLLRILAGLDRPTKGRILIDERDITGSRFASVMWQWSTSCSSTTLH